MSVCGPEERQAVRCVQEEQRSLQPTAHLQTHRASPGNHDNTHTHQRDHSRLTLGQLVGNGLYWLVQV